MKLFICTNHDGHFSAAVVASVIVAENQAQAVLLLNDALKAKHLRGGGFTLQELPMDLPWCQVIHDGYHC